MGWVIVVVSGLGLALLLVGLIVVCVDGGRVHYRQVPNGMAVWSPSKKAYKKIDFDLLDRFDLFFTRVTDPIAYIGWVDPPEKTPSSGASGQKVGA